MFNYLSIFTGLAYIVLGILVFTYQQFAVPLDEMVAYILGGIMIIYGIFRVLRALYKIKKQKQEDEE